MKEPMNEIIKDTKVLYKGAKKQQRMIKRRNAVIVVFVIIIIALSLVNCHIGNSPTGTVDTTYNTIEP